MSRLLVIGASSFVGHHIVRGLRDRYEVIGTYHRNPVRIDGVASLRMPITPDSQLHEWIRVIEPEAAIYCAGLVDEREIQANPEQAMYVNSEAPLRIAQEVKRLGGRFVYLSTSKVFSGEGEGFYTELDEPAPQGPYGKTKRTAELTLEALDNVFVLRLGTVFGLGAFRQSSDIVLRVLQPLWKRETQRLIFDEYRSFFPAESVATAVSLVLNSTSVSRGIFHLAGPDKDSYYSFARALALAFGLPTDSLIPVKGAEFRGAHAAAGGARGADLSLNGLSFREAFQVKWDPLVTAAMKLRQRFKEGF